MTAISRLSATIGFVGAGNMASALARGISSSGLPGAQLQFVDLDRERAVALAEATGGSVADSAEALARQSDVVVVAVKPPTVPQVLESLSPYAEGTLWISVAAGVPLARLQGALGDGARVVRAMPNTPALVGAGATGIVGGPMASPEDVELAETLLGAVGMTVRIEESQMDALTGLSGSGPAYAMLFIEALADGGVRAGLPRDVALRLAAQTVRGAGQLALESGKHPAELKDAVTSPAGTTIAGVEVLEQRGLRAAVFGAVVAAARRSREMKSE